MFDTEKNYEVVTFAIGDTKSGTKMGKLQLKNTEDDSILNCIMWEETLGRMDGKLFRSGNVVKIVSATYNEKFNNCLVSALELVEEAKLGLDEDQTKEAYKTLQAYTEKISNDKLKAYIKELLSQYEAEFKFAPAAKLMHHNYRGGLLTHTVECLEISDKIMELFAGKINKSEVYAACILHDFGKIFEYNMDKETGLIEYNEDFKKEWVSHSQWGFSNCMTHGFKTVAKMIATHHSRSDWGAIVDLNEKDLEPNMYLLHHIDDLSAKYGKVSVKDI